MKASSIFHWRRHDLRWLQWWVLVCKKFFIRHQPLLKQGPPRGKQTLRPHTFLTLKPFTQLLFHRLGTKRTASSHTHRSSRASNPSQLQSGSTYGYPSCVHLKAALRYLFKSGLLQLFLAFSPNVRMEFIYFMNRCAIPFCKLAQNRGWGTQPHTFQCGRLIGCLALLPYSAAFDVPSSYCLLPK